MSEGRSIRVFDYVKQPFERVRAALLADALGVFSRATTVAQERAHHVASGLRVNVAGLAISKEIHIEVLGSFDVDTARVEGAPCETRIELQWTAVGGNASLFPTMRAELALYPLSAVETQLDLTGAYQPPFGPLGTVLDLLVGHRIAEASLHRFISDVAARLERELAPGTTVPPRAPIV